MLQNLIFDALKFSKKEVPKIHINASWTNRTLQNIALDSRYLQIKVCDNGTGIEEKYLQTIFELFKRLHPKAEYEGSSLGLAFIK